MKDIGATKFSELLEARGLDFEYGQYTIFAPTDELLNDQVQLLENEGYNSRTVDDIVLFHVSAETINEKITNKKNCGEPLLMLNEELHINQESSTTECEGKRVCQIGPGNTDIMPTVVGEPIAACDSVIYVIEDMIMLPTLPAVEDQLPELRMEDEGGDDSGSAVLSFGFAAFATLLVSIL